MEVIDTAYSGCIKDFNTVACVVVVVDVAIVKDDVVVIGAVVVDAVVVDTVVDLKITKITFNFNDISNPRVQLTS